MNVSKSSIIEITLPEYRGRHIFTARLRIAAFIGFWALYIYFFKDVLDQTREVTLIISGCFILTAFAYYNVIKDRWLLLSFMLELLADLVAITVVVYLSGGPYSEYFTLYIAYCFVAGVFYNYLLAAFLAVCSVLFFIGFQLLCYWGVIPPLILYYGDLPPVHAQTPLMHVVLVVIFMSIAVYGVKIVSYFNRQREHVLEWRNKQLMALHKMSATIRSAESLDNVIKHIITNVLNGLGFESVLLVLIDRECECLKVFAPNKHPLLPHVQKIFGSKIDGIELPFSVLNTPVFQSIMKQQIIFRHDLVEVTEGLRDIISEDAARQIQSLLKIRRVVGIPLVAGREVMGAIVGLAKESFVQEATVETLESFANQAALNLEAARLIDQLKNANVKLKEANRVKSEFLAIMSHELRTPLTAIIGFSELLLEGVMGEITEEQKESVREVLNNGENLLEMINSLLDLSKIDSGKMKLDVHEFNLREMIERVLGTISSLVHKKEQKLKLEIADELPTIVGDERKIQQVLLNLLANAIKFTPKGGVISVSALHYHDMKDIVLNASWADRVKARRWDFEKGAIEIQVEDTGVGIDPQHLETIFDMFQQVDSSITRSFGGTGLGLALARQIVELHGGSIWAASELGRGARFTVVLPLGFSA